MTSCTSGTAQCVDGANVANGTSCGTDQVCNAGVCAACAEGSACSTNSNRCVLGVVSCASGAAVCTNGSSDENAGVTCGTNRVCDGSGTCVACTAGVACSTNPNPCKAGRTSCASGASVCEDATTNLANGTACGSGQVCSSGNCGTCAAGGACTTNPTPCKAGVVSCTTGSEVCVDGATNDPAGTSCGTNLVCSSAGVCTSCTAGASCTTNTNKCKTGAIACGTGAPVCSNSATNVSAGTTCGTNLVCNGTGTCVSCTAGAACTTNSNPCKVGVTSCTTGASACTNSAANQPVGTACGTNQECNGSGTCVTVVAPNLPAIAVATGRTHTCAIANNNSVWCWGGNDYGQLGNGTMGGSAAANPVRVGTLAATAISSWNDHTCVVTTAGAVRCWGYNAHGELGNNSQNNSGASVAVSGITSGATAIAVGWSHSCAIVAGGMKCWGENNSGQIGVATTNSDNALTPLNVTGLTTGVAAISAGRDGSCAVTTGGAVKCWGANYNGKVGNTSAGATNTAPVQVTGLTSGSTKVGNGYDHSCAATATGVSCWGATRYGQVGNGQSGLSSNDVLTPVALSGFTSGATAIATGWQFTCSLAGGGVKCWGSNIGAVSGETVTPTNKTGVTSGITALSAGFAHACAVTSTGLVKCWGENDFGQLGDGQTTGSTAPVTVLGFQ